MGLEVDDSGNEVGEVVVNGVVPDRLGERPAGLGHQSVGYQPLVYRLDGVAGDRRPQPKAPGTPYCLRLLVQLADHEVHGQVKF